MQDILTRNPSDLQEDGLKPGMGRLSRYASPVSMPIDATEVEATQAGLTPAQLSEADQVGRRLVEDFRPLFDTLPPQAKSGLGLARYLEIDRGTATRFIGVYAKQITGVEVFPHFPGLKGLTQIVDALAGKGVPKSSLAAARSALARFDRLISDLGITQTKLTERIAATRSGPEDHERILLSRRRGLYKAASESLGQWCDTILHVHVCRPTPGTGAAGAAGGGGGDALMDRAFLQGTLGYKARPDAPPCVFKAINLHNKSDGPRLADPKREPTYMAVPPSATQDGPDVAVMREFSSDPLPKLSPRISGDSGLVIIDAEEASKRRGLDLVLAQQVIGGWPMPAFDETPVEHMHGVRVDSPARRLVFDVYLHRTMARHFVPRTAIFRMTPGVVTGTSAAWHDQLPYPPPLEVLGEPTAQRSRFHARQPEMVAAFFDRLQWPIDEFVGYRIEVEYPHYAALYRVIFRAGMIASEA